MQSNLDGIHTAAVILADTNQTVRFRLLQLKPLQGGMAYPDAQRKAGAGFPVKTDAIHPCFAYAIPRIQIPQGEVALLTLYKRRHTPVCRKRMRCTCRSAGTGWPRILRIFKKACSQSLGNTYSIRPISALSAEPKSLVVTSCRVNKRFLGTEQPARLHPLWEETF